MAIERSRVPGADPPLDRHGCAKTRWRFRSLSSAAAVAALLGMAAAGCSDDDGTGDLPPPKPSTDTPSPTPTPTLDPIEAEIMAALERYIAAVHEVTTAPDPDGAELSQLASEGEANRVLGRARQRTDDGHVYTGSFGISDVVFEDVVLDGDGDPTAFLTMCRDVSGYTLVNVGTGEPVSVDGEELARHYAQARLDQREDQWWVSAFDWARDVPCD